MGQNAPQLFESLRISSQGLVSDLDLMQSSIRAVSLGISQSDIPDLLETSISRSKLFGITATQAFNDISLGIGRQSKLILDNLGIILDLDQTYKDYAETLHTTASALTELEKDDFGEVFGAITGATEESLEQIQTDISIKQE